MTNAEEFGARIRREILVRYGAEKEGWFADTFGINRNQFSRMLNAHVGKRPEPETIKKIADGLGRDPREVLWWSVEDVFGPSEPDEPLAVSEDESIVRDLIETFREVADPAAMAVLRDLRARAEPDVYMEAVRTLVGAFASNFQMGGKMYRLRGNGLRN